MKRLSLLLVALCFLIVPALAFAQTAQVIDVTGDVQVKVSAQDTWQNARTGMMLGKDAEIKTGVASICTLAFDAGRKNVLTLKQNSQIKLENIKPGTIYLPQGRVFTVINALSKSEKFQIRTPTAIAGARGTGWGTESQGDSSHVSCFEDTVFVQGLDQQGNPTGEQDLAEGSGMDIMEGGRLSEMTPLSDTERSEWRDFSDYSSGLAESGAGGGAGASGAGITGGDTTPSGASEGLEENKDESHQEFGDIQNEDQRQQEEEKPEDAYPGGGEIITGT